MAPPSPRRSSRARATNSLSQQSSINSGSSGRVERSTRSVNKTSSGKSTPSASLSSEPPEDFDEGHLLRRRKRGLEEDRDKISRQESLDMAHATDEIQEDDEAVRCICGFDEYPGPPPIEAEVKRTKDGQEADVFSAIELTDDISGFFVQCDICKVWQHGACVGIMTEESSPDEYFCEQCRKDLHKIHKAINGQRYSNYLPLNRPSRATSRSTSLAKDTVRSPKIGSAKSDRATSATTASKRRSTMNSREAAYDEDEQLRRAIEASRELVAGQDDGTTRRAKRSRSDSEENTTSAKRQRTSSRSSSPTADKAKTELEDESDEGTITRNGSSKKSRSSRSQKERSEREERERQRQEAAKNRKGRAERRRGDGTVATTSEKESGTHMDVDSDPSEEMPLAARVPVNKPADVQPSIEPPPPSSQLTPDTPPAGQPPAPAPAGGSHKKGARSNQKKTKGRNQYTKDREGDNEPSPIRSMSRDIARNDHEHNGGSGGNSKTSHPEKSMTKAKGAAHKISMHEIKRRSAAFLEFIAKTQVEMANEDLSEFKKDDEAEKPQQPSEEQNVVPKIRINGDGGDREGRGAEPRAADEKANEGPTEQNGKPGNPKEKNFKELNCFEMMDVLATDLVKWQNKHTA